MDKGKKRTPDELIVVEEPIIELVDVNKDKTQDASPLVSKGTITTHFIKVMNNLFDAMDLDKNLKGSYLVWTTVLFINQNR